MFLKTFFCRSSSYSFDESLDSMWMLPNSVFFKVLVIYILFYLPKFSAPSARFFLSRKYKSVKIRYILPRSGKFYKSQFIVWIKITKICLKRYISSPKTVYILPKIHFGDQKRYISFQKWNLNIYRFFSISIRYIS